MDLLKQLKHTKRETEKAVRDFQEWFCNTYQKSVSYYSPIYTSEKSNKTQEQKAQRIIEITSDIIRNSDRLESGDLTDIQLRRKIALRYFVTMRTALDYLNYAQLMLDEWVEKR